MPSTCTLEPGQANASREEARPDRAGGLQICGSHVWRRMWAHTRHAKARNRYDNGGYGGDSYEAADSNRQPGREDHWKTGNRHQGMAQQELAIDTEYGTDSGNPRRAAARSPIQAQATTPLVDTPAPACAQSAGGAARSRSPSTPPSPSRRQSTRATLSAPAVPGLDGSPRARALRVAARFAPPAPTTGQAPA